MSELVLRAFPSKLWSAVVRVTAVGALILLSAETGRLATEPQYFRDALVLCGGALIVGLGVLRPGALLVTLLVWLAVLGSIRRLVSTVTVSTGSDPLLLLGPAALALLAAIALSRGAARPRTPLSRSVIALSLIIGIETFNPRQGGLFAGASGLLFVLVPTLGFWIGRGLLDDRLFRKALVVMLALAVPAALYGLVQTLSGFPSWDQRWINSQLAQYAALNVGGVIRPFSSFSSATEYGTYLALAFMIVVVFALRRPRLLLLLGPAAVLFAVAIGYESSRGVVFALVLALGGIFAAWKRLPMLAGAATGAVFLVLLPTVVQRVVPANLGSGSGSTLLAHQLGGLSHPLSGSTSTYTIHLSLIVNGVKSAFTNPAGDGVASVTIAGAKYGTEAVSTEADPSNAAVALGLPGLIAYLAVVFFGLTTVYGLASERRDPIALAALGLVLVTFLQWLTGGQYAIAFLPWLALGWADRRRHDAAAGAQATGLKADS